MLFNTFEKNNFDWINETTKAAHFEHKKTKEIVYLLENKQISIVLNPDTIDENLIAEGKPRYSTALRMFPKENENWEAADELWIHV